ncbi:MAG: transcriptional regulator PpsR [Comamonadaceae bacterium]|nr:MAG: transcriptional regulator PpsR [Comamonadaceae bacterium]
MNVRLPQPPDLSALSGWAPELAQTFVSLASDIALVMDDGGVIRNVAQGSGEPLSQSAREWIGRSWADTVTAETRGKVELLLQEVTATGLARSREINHPLDQGGSLAVAYTAIRLGHNGPLLAVGRDLGAIAAIQQRYLDAQQEMERSYWRARQAEARYRLLFQVATDAVLVVDAQTFEIVEANQAASGLFEMPVEQVVGRPAGFGFERISRAAVEDLLTSARGSGQPTEIRARLLGKIIPTSVAATPFRTDEAMRLLMRVRTMDMPGSSADLNGTLARLVDSTSDGVVVTDSAGHVLMANPAFLRLVRMNTEAAVKGRPLMDWIGMSDAHFSSLLGQVRGHGIARRFESRLLSADARMVPVELSAALLTEGDQECIGFTIHQEPDPAGRVLAAEADTLSRAVEQLSARVGSAPLPELLRLAANLMERHFISVALERTEGNPTAAAAMLGVSPLRLDLPPPDTGHPAAEGR